MVSPVLILPGYGNSGAGHWQTLWEEADGSMRRVEQADWERPRCEAWVANLEAAVSRAGPEVVLVAHSLGCLLVAHWASRRHSPAKGALLVAVPDPHRPDYPPEALDFSQLPTQALPFPSTVVISADDPYGAPEHALALARGWGSQTVQIGPRGHINADSGLGKWPEGYALLTRLRQG